MMAAAFQPGFSIWPFGHNRNTGPFQLSKKSDHTAGASWLEKQMIFAVCPGACRSGVRLKFLDYLGFLTS
jgi:hypothetical protein